MDAEEETVPESMNMAPVVEAKRRRFGLSLRVLMVVVLVLGGGFGWLAYRARVQRQAVAAIEAAGGTVFYDWDYVNGKSIPPASRRPWPRWLLDLVGPDYLGSVTWVHLHGSAGAKADDTLMVHVGRLDRLEMLDLRDNQGVTDAGLAELRRLTRLQGLWLDSTGVRGPGLVHLQGLTRLEHLSLDDIPLADADLAQLAEITSLTSLSVRSPRITDAGLAHLARLTNLQTLLIQSPAVTNAGLAHLGALKHLKMLTLMDARVNDLTPLSQRLEMTNLALYKTPIADADLATVAGFHGLKLLMLRETKNITDAGLVYIAGLTDIDQLFLDGTGITDAGLVHIAGMSHLRMLYLGQTAITDAGLARLPDLSELVVLSLEDTKITDAGLAHLTSLAKCRQLDISGTAVTPVGIATLRARYPLMKVNAPTPPVSPR
jgi:internalin A